MKKIQNLACSILPMGLWLMIQTVAVTVFMEKVLKGEDSFVMALVDGIFLIPGILWFWKLQRETWKKKQDTADLTWKAWLRILIFGIVLQLAGILFLMLVQMFTPELMENHRQVMESLGMFSPSFLSVLYTAVLAPVTEELLFRGLTMKILSREFPFWMANMIQAFYFGLVHGNVVQGIYAFLIGLLLGLLLKKYGRLRACIACHAVVNTFGIIVSGQYIRTELLVLVLLLSLVGIKILNEDKK